MRTILVLLGAVVLALFFANPDRASAAPFEGVVAVEAGKAPVFAATAGVEQTEHCAHVPCGNSAHSHSSGPCSVHSFVAIGDGWVAPDFVAAVSIGLKNDRHSGLSLLPPVPPPLA
ncbi:MAG: hypothetical protein ABL996_19715 [Micropepsaceae bacterium]